MTNCDEHRELVDTAQRPHARRLAIDAYPLVETTPTRYSDMDANAHLNNLALESIHESARAKFNARVFPGLYDPGRQHPLRVVTSQNVVHFLAEAHWPAVFDVGVGVARIGRTSFVASSGLFLGGVCISVCNAVLVVLESGEPSRIPTDAREQMQQYLLRS
jgi:acyl-CoA thioester hydrolase